VFAYNGPAELTFDDYGSFVVPAERVHVTTTADGAGELQIAAGRVPNMTEIVTAFATGPFTLTFDGHMLLCKPRHWTVHESPGCMFELLLAFEPVHGHARLTPTD